MFSSIKYFTYNQINVKQTLPGSSVRNTTTNNNKIKIGKYCVTVNLIIRGH